jgi:serine/threonine protein kinase
MAIDAARAKSLFLAVAAMDDPKKRAAYLARECGEDAELRAHVEELLGAGDAPPTPHGEPDLTMDQSGFTARVGQVIAGRYKLLEEIGEGGMGTVFMAMQTEPVKRAVAIKIVKPGMDSKAVLARFEAERQALAMMDHPNIARVLDAGSTETGRPFFVMELVKGMPITKYCDERKLTLRQRLELFVPVCQAIQHAHQKGVIHRDIKPSNVLVAMYDDRAVPKVIDFGVAKAAGQSLTEKTLMTGFGALVGTPEYMSPEQASLNNLDIDTRSDVYSLGVLLYELLTGTTPLDRKSLGQAALLELLRIVREVEAPRPSAKLSSSHALPSIAASRNTEPAKLARLMRGELDWVLMKALEKDRARRYETANGLARDIQRYLADQLVEARPPSAGYRLRKAIRRNKGKVFSAGLVLLVLLAGIAGTTYGFLRAEQQRHSAEQQRQLAEQERQLAEKAQAGADSARQDAEARRGDAVAAQKRTEAAAEGQRKALEEEMLTLADAHTSLGLIAGEQNKPHEAVLWFASAASLAHADPQRELANRTRFATWARGLAYPVAVMPHPGQDVTRVVFHPSEDYLTFTGKGGYSLYDVRTGQAAKLRIASRGQGCAEWSPDGKLLALAGGQGRVDVYSFPECGLLHALKHPGVVRTLSFSGDGAYLAIGSEVVRVWSTAKQRFLAGELRHPQAVVGIDFDPATPRLVTSCLDNQARVFAIAGERLDAQPLFPPTAHAAKPSVFMRLVSPPRSSRTPGCS